MNLLEGELREVDSEMDLVVEGHHTSGQAAKLQLAHTESEQNGKFPVKYGMDAFTRSQLNGCQCLHT
jgi:hypothetical protein